MISPGVFVIVLFCFFLHFFEILIFRVDSGVQKIMVQTYKKFSLPRTVSQKSYIIWLSFVVNKCKMIISPGFFSFFENFDFQVVRRVKGQKIAQNDQKLCPSCLISQEPYIVWSSFMSDRCKRIIYPGFCLHFSQDLNLGVNSE